MYITAIAKKGQEFLYDYTTAHKVSKRSAETIKNMLNNANYLIVDETKQTWHVFEIDNYSRAIDYATYHRFSLRKGILKRIFGYSE